MRKRKSSQARNPLKSEVALERLSELVALRLQAPRGSRDPGEMTATELSDAVIMQPWFLPREISNAILRLLPIFHQNKWIYAFEDWGCLKCERKDAIHAGLGLCPTCYGLIFGRLKSSIVRHSNSEGPSVAELTANLTQKVDSAKQILAGHEVINAPAPLASRKGRSR